MANTVLGGLLKVQRKRLKLTQKDVANKMKVSVRTYQRLETGASMELYDDAFRALEMKVIVLPKDALI